MTDASEITETHIVGGDTKQWILRAQESTALQSAHIEHIGICDAVEPYAIIRKKLSGSFLLGTIAGEGQMLLDGRWRSHKPGMISLAPAMSLHAFHAVPHQRWKICWVRFSSEAHISQSNAAAPLIVEADCVPLQHAIEGLQREAAGPAHPASELLWVELILHYVTRVTSQGKSDPRILAVFEAVQGDFSRPWTIEDLADKANLSPEHFRRLCLRLLGRSPMRQVTALRMQRAAHLLATTDLKIEAIANEVGYQNPFAFSNTFNKLTGLRPSTVRQTRAQTAPSDLAL